MNHTATINAEFFQNLGIIAQDEGLMKRVANYVKRLAAKKEDPTLMTKEEFFARVERAKLGKSAAMLPNENLVEFLRRQGYDI